MSKDKRIELDTGLLSIEELQSLLNALPGDISFVDKDDIFRYFNDRKEMIFKRTKKSLGLTLEQCHPKKIRHMVNRIVDDFRNGKRDYADFWIKSDGRFIYINYFPVRDKNGKYIGCAEFSQDITDIKELKGEKKELE